MPAAPWSRDNQPKGVGRKRKLAQPGALTTVAEAEARIRARLPQIIDAMMDAAMGLWVQDGERVYQRPPDVKAGMYLIDRAIGRVPDTVRYELVERTAREIAEREGLDVADLIREAQAIVSQAS